MIKKIVLPLFLFILCASPLLAKDKNKEIKASVASAIQVSKAFGAVAKKAYTSVVVIENIQDTNRANKKPLLHPFFRSSKRKSPNKSTPSFHPIGRGSGFIVRRDGYIVTNQHVIKNAQYLRIKTKDGTIYDNQIDKDAIKIIGIDKHSDLAVLKIKVKSKIPYLTFADSSKVSIGDWAIAVGAPFNYDYTLTVGIVSQVGRHNVFRDRLFESYIQTDASINPGNSGGPLLDIHGDVIGVNNFIATGGGHSKSSSGIGFAITGNLVKRVVSQIIENGKVQRPWLGIAMKDLSPTERMNFNIPKGVLVTKVIPGHPAAKAGLLSGDTILQVGTNKCEKAYDIQSTVLQYKPGEKINLLIKRDGLTKTISVIAVVRDDGNIVASNSHTSELDQLGLKVKETAQGLVIEDIDKNNKTLEFSEIKKGMKILSINRQHFFSIKSLNDYLRNFKGNSLMLKLQLGKFISIEFIKWK